MKRPHLLTLSLVQFICTEGQHISHQLLEHSNIKDFEAYTKNVVQTLETHRRSTQNRISRYVSHFCLMCNLQFQVQGAKKHY